MAEATSCRDPMRRGSRHCIFVIVSLEDVEPAFHSKSFRSTCWRSAVPFCQVERHAVGARARAPQ
ncbi:hypothetical protein J6590_104372 [Homalodisca vitripennis]|nr:hypothetical protein J6590_104372 [Homalodisca vitripennis]